MNVQRDEQQQVPPGLEQYNENYCCAAVLRNKKMVRYPGDVELRSAAFQAKNKTKMLFCEGGGGGDMVARTKYGYKTSENV